jgi:hypothetical protein
MKSARTAILLALLIVSALAGLGWFFFLRPPTPLDINKVGGTILVYEIGESPFKPGKLDELATAVHERLRDIGHHSPTVSIVPPRQIEIAVVRELGHEDQVQAIKDLLATVGRLEFRIVANRHDDRLALDVAEDFFKAAAADWESLRKVVQDKFLDGKPGPLDGVLFDDVDGLVSRLVMRKPILNSQDVRQFVGMVYRPGKQLLQLRQAAKAGLPPPPPIPKPSNHFIIANEGDRGASYTWMPLSRNEIASLAGSQPRDWDETIAESLQTGLPFHSRKGAGFPLFGGPGYEAILYAQMQSHTSGKPAPVCYLLMRDPEKGKEITGTHLDSVQDTVTQDGNTAVGVQFTRKGGDLFYELTSRNKPDSDLGRRCLGIVLDGQVMVAPGVESPIREHAIIHGRFTRTEVSNMVRVLRGGELPLPLKPVPVREEVIEPGAKP